MYEFEIIENKANVLFEKWYGTIAFFLPRFYLTMTKGNPKITNARNILISAHVKLH